MAKVKNTYENLIDLAEKYGVENNPMFVSSAKRYAIIQDTIAAIGAQLEGEQEFLTSKEYVKGRENVYANPLIKELPKLSDSANRTLETMLDVIKALGTDKSAGTIADVMNGLMSDD